MITDEELMQKIDEVSAEFTGQIDVLYQAVGMIVVGRLFGWEFMRLASDRRTWTLASKLFGDPKMLMPKRGKYAHKSVYLACIDTVKEYWDVVRGTTYVPFQKRRATL